MDAPGSVAVVIPSLNEQGRIGACVASVVEGAREVVVVDGGSTDATVAEAQAAGACVVRGPRGRAAQMEAGACHARGEWLVFLHADTRLSVGWADALRRLPGDVVGGGFRFSLDSPRLRYRLVEAGVRLRCALLRLPFGDQALFARREAYRAVGGFGDVPILEDVDLIRRLRRLGPLGFPAVRALTSPRRWEQRGFLPTTFCDWSVMLLDAVGWPRERLARFYGVRGS